MLLNKEQIAAKFGTSLDIARATLAQHGVLPIDFGRGRGRGPRWYSDAVEAVLLAMHNEAQPKKAKPKTVLRGATAPLSSLSTAQILELTRTQTLQ